MSVLIPDWPVPILDGDFLLILLPDIEGKWKTKEGAVPCSRATLTTYNYVIIAKLQTILFSIRFPTDKNRYYWKAVLFGIFTAYRQ